MHALRRDGKHATETFRKRPVEVSMQVGLLLHPDRGIDAVMDEARRADRQGFHSIWLFDHLAAFRGEDVGDRPLDSLILMSALGAVTERVRLAWAMLNVSFRRPVVLAKSLATLDVITKGRVICSIGSGWLEKEYAAYDVPLIEDHDQRVEYAREVARLFRQVWTHPAPERVDFAGSFIRTEDLRFNPRPYQQPHPPIWVGGDSEATLSIVRELADGWVMLRSGTKERLAEVLGPPDWPKRPMTLVKNARIHVAETRAAALAEVEAVLSRGGHNLPPDVGTFLANEVVGTPDECVARLGEIESWGINLVRVDCVDAAHQQRIAELLLPRLKTTS